MTGGGSGIGFEISRQLGLHGARVVISGRRVEVLKDSCAALEKEGIAARYVQVRMGLNTSGVVSLCCSTVSDTAFTLTTSIWIRQQICHQIPFSRM